MLSKMRLCRQINIEQGTARSTFQHCSAMELLRTFAEDRQNFFSRRCRGQAFAHRTIIQEFRDRSESAQMRLKLIFRHDEEDDEFHRRIIQCVELDSRGRSSKSRDYLVEPVGRAVWD